MKMKMRVALEVWSSQYQQVQRTCVLAEELGFDAFYYGESPHDLNLDCWTTLAGLAGSTSRIRLGPVITNVLPSYRSTALLAKQAATVAAISEGRLDFRTGVGAAANHARPWWEPYGVDYPGYDQRLAHLQQALETFPGLWSDVASPVPITVAATGQRALRLAAAHADVWETSFCTPAEFAGRNATFASLIGGRNVVRSLEIDGFMSTTTAGVDTLLAQVRADRAAEDLAPVLQRALVGAPADVAAQLQALRVAGVDQVVVALHDPHNADALKALAHAVTLVRDLL